MKKYIITAFLTIAIIQSIQTKESEIKELKDQIYTIVDDTIKLLEQEARNINDQTLSVHDKKNSNEDIEFRKKNSLYNELHFLRDRFLKINKDTASAIIQRSTNSSYNITFENFSPIKAPIRQEKNHN